MNLYNLIFWMVFLLYNNINKMATNGGGRVGRQQRRQSIASHIDPGLKSQPGFFFPLIFVRIHTNEFIQLLYKLCSTNSYTMWFLYQFVHFYTNCIVRIHTTSRERAARAVRAAKPEHTSCPNQAAPGCLDLQGTPGCPDQLGCVRCPDRQGTPGCPDQLGCVRGGTYVCRLLLGRNSK